MPLSQGKQHIKCLNNTFSNTMPLICKNPLFSGFNIKAVFHMKILRFLISFAITVVLVGALSMKIGPAPPLGKFLDPFNGFWANARAADQIPLHLSIPELQSPVTVRYDELLIPHIFASNENDLYLATGYVHAFHRLWQMEFQTHAAAGRLSEIAGNVTLNMDRAMRRKGMVFGAKNFINNIDQESKTMLMQYAKGVNFMINQLSYKDLPFEYKLLNYKPEDWTILKSGLLYKYMSDMLNSGEKDLENTNFSAIYGKEMLDLIYPDVDCWDDPVVEKPNDWGFEPITEGDKAVNNTGLTRLKPLPSANTNNGSNNWAVGPGKSATDNPVLCNDMHLNMSMPSLWFYQQLSAGDINVFGHALPGIPFVITGFTDSVAWGFTNAQRDLVDWFKIEYQDEKRLKYLLDGEYVSVEWKIEEIGIRGQEPFIDTVAYTVFGPVTYDRSFRADSEKNGLARRWIDHDPSSGLKMFYYMNKAKSFKDYMNALDHFTSPAQNVVFASVQGDIAHRVQGRYPLNSFEEGKFIKDGTLSSNNWSAFIPNSHNAYWKNPERGFVASANQHPADSAYPYYFTARSYESYRNRRINDMLRADSSVTIEDMKNLHFDNYSTKAAESLPFMIEMMNGIALNAQEMDMIESLKNWDYLFNADTQEGVYYDLWFNYLYRSIWDEITASREEGIWLSYPTSYATIRLMKENSELPFFDNTSTQKKEQVKDLVMMAFREMMTKVAGLGAENGQIDWAGYKATYIGHQLRIKALGSHNVRAGGQGGDVVNATGSSHGPSQRIIIELDPEGVKALGHYPGGQSGNPGSKYYDNMVDAWANGEYFELLLLKSADDMPNRIVQSQTLTPKK
jgi:penicillin amidase